MLLSVDATDAALVLRESTPCEPADFSADSKIVIIGGGKMGEAILAGWLAATSGVAAAISASQIVVVNPGQERRDVLSQRYGVSCVADASDAPKADIVVLAVKPQVMMDVLAVVSSQETYCSPQARPLFISIAAGLTTGRLEAALPTGARLVRVMPNMPLAVGQGATAVCAGECASDADVLLVRDLFACLGDACVVDESVMDAVCAVSGSGPAYVAAMIEALRDAGVAHGLAYDVAERLALQTVFGTASLLKTTGQDIAACRESICSPGGTTLAALAAMDNAGFRAVFEAGVSAAVTRSKELASQ